jgi:hypothetical protein
MNRDQDAPKCARCSVRILDGEMVVRDHGDWLHVRCVRILTSDSRVRKSRALARMSRRLIESGRERIERTLPLGERPVILCVVCGDRVDSASDVTIDSSGPAHNYCRQENSPA